MSYVIQRNPFKCFVSIEKTIDDSSINKMMSKHIGYPIDNVIQIKLSKDSFTKLFKSSVMNSSSVNVAERYNSPELLTKLENFFSNQYNNYNSIASDITILISNSLADEIDIHPVNLENACKPNGQIFNYFFLSECTYLYSSSSTENYDDTTSNPGKMKVYQAIARELDNMITRDISIDETTSVETLEELYSIHKDNFWNNLVEGDSIFVDGSFNIPGNYNVPIILQFVNINKEVAYSFTTEINGSALDGYISNGNVKILSLDNKLLYETITNSVGDFSVINIDPPFKVEISGGIDIATNESNDLVLTSLKMNTQDDLTVTPITSMLVDTFEEQGLNLTEENLTSVKSTIATKMGINQENIYEDFISTNNSNLASKALQLGHLFRVVKSLGISDEKQIKKKLVSKILENNLETVSTDSTTIQSLITDIYDTFDSTNTNRTQITTNAVQIIKTVNENYKNSQNNLANLYKISKGYQKNNSIIKNGVIDHTQSTENISNSIQNSIDEIPIESIYKLNKNDSSKSEPLILKSVKIPFNENLIVYLDASNYNIENPTVWNDKSDYKNNINFSTTPIYNNSSLSMMQNEKVIHISYKINNLLFNNEYTLIYIVNLKELYENTKNHFIPYTITGNFKAQRTDGTPYIKFDLNSSIYNWDAKTYFDANPQRKETYFMICLRKIRFDINLYKTNLQLYDSEGSLLINEISSYNSQIGNHLYWLSTEKLRSIILYNSILSNTDLENIRDYYLLSSSEISYPMISIKKISEITSSNVLFELKSTVPSLTVTKISDSSNVDLTIKHISNDGNILFYPYMTNKTVYIKYISSNIIEEIKDETKNGFGRYLEISGDGNLVAIGDSYKNWYIYKKNNANWSKIKEFLIENNNYSNLKFNYDGSVLVRGYGNNTHGKYKYVRIYKYENSDYATEFSQANQYQSGFASYICINKSGNVIAYYSGRFNMVKKTNGIWNDFGKSSTNNFIEGSNVSKFIKIPEFISNDGNMLFGKIDGQNKYRVLKYNILADKWFQKGNDIEYVKGFGFSYKDISNDSNIIVLSGSWANSTENIYRVGNISVFVYNKETNQYNLFKEIDGINEYEQWGSGLMKIVDKDNKQKIKIITSNKNNEILHLEMSNLDEIYNISSYQF